MRQAMFRGKIIWLTVAASKCKKKNQPKLLKNADFNDCCYQRGKQIINKIKAFRQILRTPELRFGSPFVIQKGHILQKSEGCAHTF